MCRALLKIPEIEQGTTKMTTLVFLGVCVLIR